MRVVLSRGKKLAKGWARTVGRATASRTHIVRLGDRDCGVPEISLQGDGATQLHDSAKHTAVGTSTVFINTALSWPTMSGAGSEVPGQLLRSIPPCGS